MQKEKAKKRNDNDPPEAIAEWGWQYHHMGIPTKEKMPNERYLPHLKMYVTGFETSPFGIEWMRFEEDCPISEIVRTVPHIAFEVDNLEKSIEGKELIGEPSIPSKGIKVAMIKHNGVPVELMEFEK
jgi:hypothetical protein